MDTRIDVATDARLTELARRLVEAVHPRKIYLFGSGARGDERAESDYDVLLLVDDCLALTSVGSARHLMF